LCIIALDTLHRLRHARPIPRGRIRELAAFLDFQACVNAELDHKRPCRAECAATQRRLEQAGCGPRLERYLSQLRALELQRPSMGGDRRGFDHVRAYREAVARLSLDTVSAFALDVEYHDPTLFRIVMQCQILDDVLDYRDDQSLGLPSFLTACTLLSEARALTAEAARRYGDVPELTTAVDVLPLRLALGVVTALTRFAVWAAVARGVSPAPASAAPSASRAN
jgi:hypothetical protein